ncbi:hypothetical protein DPMN_154009 [Dreissena polymorpha]|uniref:Uncharacterized protein n=2 Tax=Dreissena polymorpha TaxID=45954 RepID=A0A9D4J5B9_DREPO|nr:hypothetical protein DPMN_154009 [Dreissena polymorpha]
MQDNCIEWVSYVDGYSEDNPFIDNIALKFLRQIMRPDRSKHKMENDPSSIAVPSRHEVEQRQMSGKELTEDNHLYKQYILIGLVFACALIAGTYKLVSKPASK